MQFYHPRQNKFPGERPVSNIASIYAVPEAVSTILIKSCTNCHSNYTRYPWYVNVEPIGWWLEQHIRDGKRSLNFDEFGIYKISKQYERMQDVIDEVKKGDMPLASYTLVHRHSGLKDNEKALIIAWANAVRDTIKQKYPVDSLIKKN